MHLDQVENFLGFSTSNSKGGQYAWVLTRSAVTSDDANFYTYMRGFENSFLNPAKVPIDGLHHFLILLHKDLTVDIYVNDFSHIVEMRTKRAVQKGGEVTKADIADIRKLKLPDITMIPTDKVIYCFKVGWRFGLYFDLDSRGWTELETTDKTELDIVHMQTATGRMYRYLAFYEVYKSIETEKIFKRIRRDGWFPFVEILGSEYDRINTIYKSNFQIKHQVNNLIEAFNKERINNIKAKWWTQPAFKDKKVLIQAGIDAYLQDNRVGYINCIKNLWTEIEGVLRAIYLSETGKGKSVKSSELIDHIVKRAKKSTDDTSLFLPESFLLYLKDVVFANFDGESKKQSLSRNTSSHGVAGTAIYTKAHALQLILILDQIYFYSI